MAERGAGLPQWSLSPQSLTVQYSQRQLATSGTASGWFGPLQPMNPSAPADVAGRQFDFQSGFNLLTRPRATEGITFANLRMLAESYDLLRLVIETRKDQVERMAWSIRPKPETKASAADIGRVTDFFNNPEGPYGTKDFTTWLRVLLEDLFVLDAPTLYCGRDRAGRLLGLLPLDGATIKPVIDEWGRLPMPIIQAGKPVFPVAYQQILKGLPAVDYTARDLILQPRNPRSHKVYGLGPVEQIIMTVSIALRRQQHQLAYYTEGNIPESLIGTPEGWTPDQIKTFQDYWDAYFTGDIGARRRAKFVPGGVAKTFIQTREPELKSVFDEWLARVVCFAFSVSHQPFVNQVNRATAGTAKEQAEEEGLFPVLSWIKRLANRIIQTEFNLPNLEFAWGDDEQIDPQIQQQTLVAYSNAGIMTRNEAREKMGLDPIPNTPEMDEPMILTGTGLVPLNSYQQDQDQKAAQAQQAAETAKANLAAAQQNAPSGENQGSEPPEKPVGGKEPVPGAKVPETEKLAFSPSGTFTKGAGKQGAAIPFPRPLTNKAQKAIKSAVSKTFGVMLKDVASHVREALADVAKLAKADDAAGMPKDQADDLGASVAKTVDLSAFDDLIGGVGDALGNVAGDTAERAILQIGPDASTDLVDRVNVRAVTWARERAADLVGKRVLDDGSIVDNPRAKMAITDSTRDMIRNAVSDGLEQNTGIDAIVQKIEDLAFSPDRADLIAETEVGNANSNAALIGFKGAADMGVTVKKAWSTAADEKVEEVCRVNEEAGALDLDEAFPSGDQSPLAHPRCRCALVPVVEDE